MKARDQVIKEATEELWVKMFDMQRGRRLAVTEWTEVLKILRGRVIKLVFMEAREEG